MRATRSDSFQALERSVSIQAPSDKIYALIEDFHGWRSWSPWENIDPGLQRTYNGPCNRQGRDLRMVQGRKTRARAGWKSPISRPTWRVLIKLDFIRPFECSQYRREFYT